MNQTARAPVHYPVKAPNDPKRVTVLTALYLKQFLTYWFDKKGLGSQDIQDVLKSNIGHHNKWSQPLKYHKGLNSHNCNF